MALDPFRSYDDTHCQEAGASGYNSIISRRVEANLPKLGALAAASGIAVSYDSAFNTLRDSGSLF